MGAGGVPDVVKTLLVFNRLHQKWAVLSFTEKKENKLVNSRLVLILLAINIKCTQSSFKSKGVSSSQPVIKKTKLPLAL